MFYTNYFLDVLQEHDDDRVLLFEDGCSVKKSELIDTSKRLAYALQKQGVKQGDRVILAVKPGVEFLQIMYANMILRTMVSIIDPEMGRENYNAKLQQFDPAHAFVDSRLVLLSEHPVAKYLLLKLNKTIPSFPFLRNTNIYTSGIWLPILQKHTRIKPLIKKGQSDYALTKGNDLDDFLVTYTSGTLAQPKGVVHSYQSVSKSIHHLSALLKRNQDTAISTHLPHFALLGISSGVQVYLWNNEFSAQEKLNYIEKHSISTLFGPPSDFLPMINLLLQSKKKFPACLKNIYLGSAPVYSAFLTKLLTCCDQLNVTCLYGMTENLMVASIDAIEKVNADVEGDMVGRPFPNVTLGLENDSEITVQSDQLFTRYFGMEKHNGIHLTGDMGKIDEHGRLILHGRKKDMIIRGNFNIYPGLYEATINKIDGVVESAMIGYYNAQKADEEIILVIESEYELNAKNIMSKLQSGKFSIDKEALPDRILFLELPRSGRQNKVNRKVLAEIVKDKLQ